MAIDDTTFDSLDGEAHMREPSRKKPLRSVRRLPSRNREACDVSVMQDLSAPKDPHPGWRLEQASGQVEKEFDSIY